jgi:TetR/AcrR family transcriptional regulator, regulator of mycofactocin system
MDAPSRKRDATREKLLRAATQRFLAHGYDGTTAAAIADDAGVTERTFFRYFPTKADVLVANWQQHAAAALRVGLTESAKANVSDAVRDVLTLFTSRLESEFGPRIRNVVHLYTDRNAFQAIMGTLFDFENRLAHGIARRTGRSTNDFAVRAAANASIGVLRAAIRANVVDPESPPTTELIAVGMRRLRGCFNALSQ